MIKNLKKISMNKNTQKKVTINNTKIIVKKEHKDNHD